MNGPNLKLGTAFGIDVLLHWSFFLLPLGVVWLSVRQGDSLAITVLSIVLLVVILASVLWHELGHAVTARRLGIPILDIMLTPICGLARLEGPPRRPGHEIAVALAGPLANLLIAGIVAGLLWIGGQSFSLEHRIQDVTLLSALFWINIALFSINLLPIFPMDGGRVLRAGLAMRMNDRRATLIAARIGQGLSILTAIAGAGLRIWPLVVIGVFLLLTAEQEIRYQRRKSG